MIFVFCGHCRSTGTLPVYLNGQQWGEECPYCFQQREDAAEVARQEIEELLPCRECGVYEDLIFGLC